LICSDLRDGGVLWILEERSRCSRDSKQRDLSVSGFGRLPFTEIDAMLSSHLRPLCRRAIFADARWATQPSRLPHNRGLTTLKTRLNASLRTQGVRGYASDSGPQRNVVGVRVQGLLRNVRMLMLKLLTGLQPSSCSTVCANWDGSVALLPK
jgi:hypothetical protein